MTVNTSFELVSWEHFHELARKLSLAIFDASFQPELIVAISRGGCIPARVICDYLDLFDLDFVKIEHYYGTQKDKCARLRYPLSAKVAGKRVLLLDDVSDTGDSFELAISHLLANGEPSELKTAVLHHKTVSSYTPDFYAEIVKVWRWIIYPWAVMEDLRSILQEMDLQPSNADEWANYLEQKYGLAVPRQTLEDILSMASEAADGAQ